MDEISFSLDGYDALTNDIVRGAGAFDKARQRLKDAITLGLNTHITACVTEQNTRLAGSVSTFMHRMILFAQGEGANTINFHGVFRMGVPMDAWTHESHLLPEDWIFGFRDIQSRIESSEYRINVRLPAHVIERYEFDANPKYYGYCPAKLGERVLIHPNGLIRICSSLLCTPYCVARYDAHSIQWEKVTNELYKHDLQTYTPCTNQQALYSKHLVPVCFSLKPKQREPVWQSLGYDSSNEIGAFS